jgi:hypothetical protein
LEAHWVVAPEQIELWNRLVCEHHYLKNANLVGEQLRYVVTYQDQWVALLGWSAASFHLKDREKWVGWSNLQRRSRLPLFAQNSRFVVLVDRTKWPNLASRSLALVCQRLSQDWQQAYGHPIAAVESFVDSQVFRGTAYKANGWGLLGETDGFGRVAEDFYLCSQTSAGSGFQAAVWNSRQRVCGNVGSAISFLILRGTRSGEI